MTLKIIFLLCVCSTLVLSFNIDSRIKRQANETETTTTRDVETATRNDEDSDINNRQTESESESQLGLNSGNSGDNGLGSFFGSDNNSSDGSSNDTQGFGKRLQNAFNNTYQEERNSVSDSWNNKKKLAHQDIETKANLTKTGFDLGTIIPKFGKNFIINN